MKATVLLLFGILLVSATELRAQDNVLARVNYQGKYGFINPKGDFVVQPQYDYALRFNEGLAAVELGDKYGFIDSKGQIVIGFQFDDAKWFFEGLAAVRKEGKYGFIDRSGRLVIDFKYDDTFDFSEGRADVKIGDECGYIDKTGDAVIPIKYETCYRFKNGTAVVQDAELVSYLIDRQGKVLESNTKVDPLNRDDPAIKAYWDAEKKAAGLKHRNGSIILEARFESVGVFQEGRSIVKEKGKWGIVDKTGKFI
ncbi:MAG: WG repeat-containing protein, partial [Acidobacteriota bacterium]